MRSLIFFISLFLLCSPLVFASVDWSDPYSFYYDPLNYSEFNALNDSELQNWDLEYRGFEDYGQTTFYFYYMNTYFEYLDENNDLLFVPCRLTFYQACSLESCSEYLDQSFLNIQYEEFKYFGELKNDYG